MTNVVTCRTEDCPNAGVGIPMELSYVSEEDGETYWVSSVSCGPCGQPITDIEPPIPGTEPPPPDEIDNSLPSSS